MHLGALKTGASRWVLLRAGARGYLTKDASSEDIHTAAAGAAALDPAVQNHVVAALSDDTRRSGGPSASVAPDLPRDRDTADVSDSRPSPYEFGKSYPRGGLPVCYMGGVEGDLIWELRRLLAWSGGTIADVTQALELRGSELDGAARALLREEVDALDSDLALLRAVLTSRLDWDRAYERLLAGEIPPFDEHALDEDEDEEDVR